MTSKHCLLLMCSFVGLLGCSATADRASELQPAARTISPPALQVADAAPLSRVEALALPEALMLGRQYSPVLAAAERGIGQAKARTIQAKAWPNPTLEVEADDIPAAGFGFRRSTNTVTLEQNLALGGRISAGSLLAGLEEDQACHEYEATLREVSGEIRARFYAVLAAQERISYGSQTQGVAAEIHRVTKERVEVGAATLADEIKARIQLNQGQLTLAGLDAELLVAKKRLCSSLGLPDLEIARCDGALDDLAHPLAKEAIRELVLENSPYLLAAEKAREIAEARVLLAKTERVPDISVRLGYGRTTEESETEEGAEYDRSGIWTLGISMPLPLFNRNEGAIAEAQHGSVKAAHEYRAREAQLLAQFEDEFSTHTKAQAQVGAYRDKIVPDAQEVLDLVGTGYEQGKFSYVEVLDAQRTIAEARQSYVDALELLSISRVNLERLCGPISGEAR